MSKLIAIFAILAATLSLALASGIKWNTDLAKAMKIAKKSKKPVMIDFFGEY